MGKEDRTYGSEQQIKLTFSNSETFGDELKRFRPIF